MCGWCWRPRRNSLDSVAVARLGTQPVHQIRQSQQAADRERAPAIRDHHERIGRRDVGPPRRQREQLTILVMQMNPVLTPVLPVRDELEVPPRQRLEPVRHTHTSIPVIGIGCSRRRRPTP
jgi:hypothetical protein